MKKLLLGTSALVAAGLFSNGALAQTATTDTPVKFAIGGQYYAGVGDMVSQSDQPGDVAYKREALSIQEYFLIKFVGSTTFSNGITAGVWTRLNAFSAPNGTANTSSGFQSSNNTTIKDSYVYLKNAATWGEFRLGDDSDVRRAVATGNLAGVTGDGNIGANSAALQWLNLPVWNETTLNLDGRGTKAVYYSPTISGFQLAASFAPDKAGGHGYGPGNGGDNSGLTDRIVNGDTASYDNNENAYNYWSLAGSWTGTFGPTKVQGTVGYSTASRKCAVSSGTTVALGTSAGASACTIQGSGGTQSADPHVYNAGIQVDNGPWELGLDYEQSVGITGGLTGGSGVGTVFNAAGAVSTSVVKSDEMINKQLDVNLSYTIGAIRFGGEFSRSTFEGITGDANVKRAPINTEVQIGAAYQVGPGVQIAGILQAADYDAAGRYIPLASGAQNVYAKSADSTALIFTTSLKF